MKILDFSAESIILVLISRSRWVLKLEQLFPLKVRNAKRRGVGWEWNFCVSIEKTGRRRPATRQVGPRARRSLKQRVSPDAVARPFRPVADFQRRPRASPGGPGRCRPPGLAENAEPRAQGPSPREQRFLCFRR